MRFVSKITALVLLLTPTAFVDQFEDETLRMLELSNSLQPVTDAMDQMLQAAGPAMKQQMFQQMKSQGKDVTPEDVDQLVDDFREQMVEQMGLEMVPLIVAEYRKHFTLEEIVALNDVMATPAYQTFAKRTPELMRSAQAEWQALGDRKRHV